MKKQTVSPAVPNALKFWFIVHFILDLSAAIPLFLFPVIILEFLGWTSIDPAATRLFAAALFAIGTESFLGRNSSCETYQGMLNLKIIWSFFAIIGLAITIWQGGAGGVLVWLALTVFFLFNILWIYWKVKLSRL